MDKELFLSELIALCKKHQIEIAVSLSDDLLLVDRSEEPIKDDESYKLETDPELIDLYGDTFFLTNLP